MPKTIRVRLSQQSIDDASKEVMKYRDDLKTKVAVFTDRLKEYGIEVVNAYMKNIPNPTGATNFDSGTDYWNFNTDDSETSASRTSATAIIRVSGERLLYVEFGYGINAVYAPHPTGMYGAGSNSPAGHGTDEKGWWYTGTDGESHHTYGAVAYAPVWNTALHLRTHKDVIHSIAKEVFG